MNNTPDPDNLTVAEAIKQAIRGRRGGGKHRDADGNGVADYAERKAPGGLLTVNRDLGAELAVLLTEQDLVEQAPDYTYPEDPDDPENPLVLTEWEPGDDLTVSMPRRAAPGVAAVMASGGIGSGDLFAGLAAAAGLELAAACTVLEKESGGSGDVNQRNVWGHDGVDTGGCYTKGSPVTQQNYGCVRASRTAGFNGVGPVQITWSGYWVAADKRGGAWRPEVSTAVGFETLAQGIRANGVRTGFRAYNGSGAQAERYADDALVRLARWRQRLAGAPAPPPPPGGRPTLRPGDTGPLVGAVQQFFNAVFPAYSRIPVLNPPIFGPVTTGVVQEFQRRSGIPAGGPCEIGPKTWAAMEKSGFRG